MPLALAAALLCLGLARASAGEVPQEILDSWDAGRKDAATTWTELPFRDEHGVKRSLWGRTAELYPVVAVGDPTGEFDKKRPLFLLEAVTPPSGAPEGVSYKKATLSAYEYTPEKVSAGGYNRSLTVSGTNLKLRPDSPYTYNGVSYPAKPTGQWVVLAPSAKEKLTASPMGRVGTWPLCSLSPDSTYNGTKYAAVYEKLHPTEVILAYGNSSYGARFTSSTGFVKALDDAKSAKPETAYSYAEGVRKAVFSGAKAKGDATPASEPREQLTAEEAQFLACQISGLSSSFYEDKFTKGMRDAKDKATWVKNWRGFIHAEHKAYAAAAKDFPGAKTTSTPWEGLDKLDYRALLKDLKSRTEKAIDSAGAPPDSAAVAKPKVGPKTKRRVDDAGSWAEDLVR